MFLNDPVSYMINDIHRKLSSCRSSCKFQQYPTLYATPTPPPNDESSMEVCQVLLLWSIVWSGHYRTHCGVILKKWCKKIFSTIFRMFFDLWWLFIFEYSIWNTQSTLVKNIRFWRANMSEVSTRVERRQQLSCLVCL